MRLFLPPSLITLTPHSSVPTAAAFHADRADAVVEEIEVVGGTDLKSPSQTRKPSAAFFSSTSQNGLAAPLPDLVKPTTPNIMRPLLHSTFSSQHSIYSSKSSARSGKLSNADNRVSSFARTSSAGDMMSRREQYRNFRHHSSVSSLGPSQSSRSSDWSESLGSHDSPLSPAHLGAALYGQLPALYLQQFLQLNTASKQGALPRTLSWNTSSSSRLLQRADSASRDAFLSPLSALRSVAIAAHRPSTNTVLRTLSSMDSSVETVAAHSAPCLTPEIVSSLEPRRGSVGDFVLDVASGQANSSRTEGGDSSIGGGSEPGVKPLAARGVLREYNSFNLGHSSAITGVSSLGASPGVPLHLPSNLSSHVVSNFSSCGSTNDSLEIERVGRDVSESILASVGESRNCVGSFPADSLVWNAPPLSELPPSLYLPIVPSKLRPSVRTRLVLFLGCSLDDPLVAVPVNIALAAGIDDTLLTEALPITSSLYPIVCAVLGVKPQSVTLGLQLTRPDTTSKNAFGGSHSTCPINKNSAPLTIPIAPSVLPAPTETPPRSTVSGIALSDRPRRSSFSGALPATTTGGGLEYDTNRPLLPHCPIRSVVPQGRRNSAIDFAHNPTMDDIPAHADTSAFWATPSQRLGRHGLPSSTSCDHLGYFLPSSATFIAALAAGLADKPQQDEDATGATISGSSYGAASTNAMHAPTSRLDASAAPVVFETTVLPPPFLLLPVPVHSDGITPMVEFRWSWWMRQRSKDLSENDVPRDLSESNPLRSSTMELSDNPPGRASHGSPRQAGTAESDISLLSRRSLRRVDDFVMITEQFGRSSDGGAVKKAVVFRAKQGGSLSMVNPSRGVTDIQGKLVGIDAEAAASSMRRSSKLRVKQGSRPGLAAEAQKSFTDGFRHGSDSPLSARDVIPPRIPVRGSADRRRRNSVDGSSAGIAAVIANAALPERLGVVDSVKSLNPIASSQILSSLASSSSLGASFSVAPATDNDFLSPTTNNSTLERLPGTLSTISGAFLVRDQSVSLPTVREGGCSPRSNESCESSSSEAAPELLSGRESPLPRKHGESRKLPPHLRSISNLSTVPSVNAQDSRESHPSQSDDSGGDSQAHRLSRTAHTQAQAGPEPGSSNDIQCGDSSLSADLVVVNGTLTSQDDVFVERSLRGLRRLESEGRNALKIRTDNRLTLTAVVSSTVHSQSEVIEAQRDESFCCDDEEVTDSVDEEKTDVDESDSDGFGSLLEGGDDALLVSDSCML